MECINFSETKAERKYYEKKKQKALRYLDHTIEKFDSEFYSGEKTRSSQFKNKLETLRKLVNDI